MMYFLTVGLHLFLETQFVTETQSYITITLFTLNYTLVQRETWNSLLQKDPDRAVRSCVSHSNILISLVRRAPVLSRRHAISNSTDLTCVITCSERLWPVQQHLSSPDQSNTQHFDCRRLHTAIWRHLREQSRFQASRRVMSYVSMCGQYGGLTDQLGVWHALCLQQRHNFQLFGFVSPPPSDWHGRISQDITAHVTEYPLRHKQGALRPHLIVIYGQLLWFQSAAGKQRAKTLRTYNYGDQTLWPFSAMMG